MDNWRRHWPVVCNDLGGRIIAVSLTPAVTAASHGLLWSEMAAQSLLLLLLVLPWTGADKRYHGGYSGGGGCNSCTGGSPAYNNGRNLGQSVAGAIGNKLQHIAGFVDGLVAGPPANTGCSVCSSSYVPASNPCPSNSCYNNCGNHGCGSSQAQTVILVQPASPSSSSSSYSDCQCDYLFNRAGQGNCNAAGARSHTSDRWCYIAEDLNGRWVEAQWACPDAVRSDVHTGRSVRQPERTQNLSLKLYTLQFFSVFISAQLSLSHDHHLSGTGPEWPAILHDTDMDRY